MIDINFTGYVKNLYEFAEFCQEKYPQFPAMIPMKFRECARMMELLIHKIASYTPPEERNRVFSSEPSYYMNCNVFSDLPQKEDWE